MTDKSLGTFINPFTDFGFKKIFGSEESKPLLISFLNDLLPIKHKIVSLEFKNIEKLGLLEEDRRAILIFIVVMKKIKNSLLNCNAQNKSIFKTAPRITQAF